MPARRNVRSGGDALEVKVRQLRTIERSCRSPHRTAFDTRLRSRAKVIDLPRPVRAVVLISETVPRLSNERTATAPAASRAFGASFFSGKLKPRSDSAFEWRTMPPCRTADK